jgi:serine O-acetyltransferase
MNVSSSSRLVAAIAEEFRANQPRAWASPGFHAILVHRLGAYRVRAGLPRVVDLPLRTVYTGLAAAVQALYGIEVPAGAILGRRVTFGHQAGTVIAGGARIGDDCLIRQNVTIGAAFAGGPAPTIGDSVEIGAGAVIVGGVTVGDRAVIGPNAVVSFDVPAGAHVVAPAPRVLRYGEDPAAPVDPPAATHTGGDATVEDVVEFVARTLGLDEAPAPDDPLVSSGIIDSLALVTVLDALEAAYAVRVPTEALDASQVDTARDLATLIERARR